MSLSLRYFRQVDLLALGGRLYLSWLTRSTVQRFYPNNRTTDSVVKAVDSLATQ